jgi:hypothetical protein
VRVSLFASPELERNMHVGVRAPWQEFGWGELDEPGPQTETAVERGFRLAGPVDNEFGHSDGLDPDNVGDIADEGTGHRG